LQAKIETDIFIVWEKLWF